MIISWSLLIFKVIGQRSSSKLDLQYFQLWQPCHHSTLTIPWPIFIKLIIQLVYDNIWSLLIFKVIGQRSSPKLHLHYFQLWQPCHHSTLTITWQILTKLGIQLLYDNILKPIDFQGHRSKVKLKIGLTIFSAVAALSQLYTDHSLTDLNKTYYTVSLWYVLKPIGFQGHRSKVMPKIELDWTYNISQLWQPCHHSTLTIPWQILSKLGIQLVCDNILKPIDSRS